MSQQHAALGVVVRVALREFVEHAHDRRREERQVGERGAPFVALSIQVRAQRLEFGDVDFFDVGEVRDVARRFAHALRDHAPHADHLDLLTPLRGLSSGLAVPVAALRGGGRAVTAARSPSA